MLLTTNVKSFIRLNNVVLLNDYFAHRARINISTLVGVGPTNAAGA